MVKFPVPGVIVTFVPGMTVKLPVCPFRLVTALSGTK
jgi:hypothetical protein